MRSSAGVLGDSNGRCGWGTALNIQVGKEHILCSLPHRRTGSNLSPQDPALEIHAGNLGLTKLVPALHSRAMLPVWFLIASLGPFCMD